MSRTKSVGLPGYWVEAEYDDQGRVTTPRHWVPPHQEKIDLTPEEESQRDADDVHSEEKRVEAARVEAIRQSGRAKLHQAAGLTQEESDLQR